MIPTMMIITEAIAIRLAIANSRKIYYCQTSGNCKYSEKMLFSNLLLPDVFYKICAEIYEYVYRTCRKYACRS